MFCLVRYIRSSYMSDVCLHVCCLHICKMSAPICDVCISVWCLLNFMASAQIYDVCLHVWLISMMLLYGMTSAYLDDFFLPVLCLPKCVTSALQHDPGRPVWNPSTVWCLHTFMVFSYLYDAFLLYLYDVCPPVWWLLSCMVSAYRNCKNAFSTLLQSCPSILSHPFLSTPIYSTLKFNLAFFSALWSKQNLAK
jgi:hypothetical protein